MNYLQENWDDAEKHYQRAYNVNVQENASGMMTAAILYRLGSVSVAKGDIPLAM
jgi:hypothetical protein